MTEIDAVLAAFAAHGGAAPRPTRRPRRLARTRRARAQGESRAGGIQSRFSRTDGEDEGADLQSGHSKGARRRSARPTRSRRKPNSPPLTDKLAHVRLAEASAAVLALADAVQADYERRKQAEAALDYDDLIVKAQNLLSRSGAAAWVLYKIDGGIDHILVDEAQDTNPAQWSIIESLAAEFFAGSRARARSSARCSRSATRNSRSTRSRAPTRRGSPRWAAPSGESRKRFGLAWHEVPLNLSFRSTAPILASSGSRVRQAACRRRAHLAGGRDHRAPRRSARARRGWSSCGRCRPRRSRAQSERVRAVERGIGRRPRGRCAVQAHRRGHQRLARQRRTASPQRPHGAGRRYPDPGPPARPVHHAHDPRVETAARGGGGRRPHEADGSACGAGPGGARRHAADAGGRPRRSPWC